jgi:hypothetical protein
MSWMGDSAVEACPTCGAGQPLEARYCSSCGSRLAGEAAPVRWERRTFGLAPPLPLLALSLAALGIACFLLASGRWPTGLALLPVGLALALLFVSAARQQPDARVAGTALRLVDAARRRSGFAWVAATSWSAAGREVVRLRARERRLRHEQRTLLQSLGEAVLRERSEEASLLESAARIQDELIEACLRDLEQALAHARERIDRERLTVQPTEALASDPPGGPSR